VRTGARILILVAALGAVAAAVAVLRSGVSQRSAGGAQGFASEAPTQAPTSDSGSANEDSVARLLRLASGAQHAAALYPELDQLPQSSLASVARALGAQKLTPATRALLLRAVARLALFSPEQALAIAREFEPAALRQQCIKSVFSQLIEANPESAARLAVTEAGKALPPASQRDVILGACSAWAARSPGDAAEFAASLEDSEFGSGPLMEVTSTWAVNDPVSALAWIAQQPDGPTKNSARSAAFAGWSSVDGASAAEAYAKLPVSERARLSGIVAGNWARVDPEAAAKWAASLPDLEDQMRAASLVTEPWAESDPQAAAQWVNSLTSQETATAAAGALITSWAASDPQAAFAWSVGQPEQAIREACLLHFTEAAMYDSPKLAAEAALKLTDPTRRAEQLAAVLKYWQAMDPPAADAWRNAHLR
jgi:hypothetical protein